MDMVMFVTRRVSWELLLWCTADEELHPKCLLLENSSGIADTE